MNKVLIEADAKYLGNAADESLWISPGVANVVNEVAKMYESEAGAKDGWESPRVSWKNLKEACFKQGRALLREAIPAQAFGQLQRAGIQMIANAWYRRAPSTYQEIAQEYASDKRQEFHAPLFGASFPRKIGAGTPWREQNVVGQDVEIINIKWGGMESFERELFDDDQTGQIRQRAQNLGEAMRLWEDAYFSRRFVGGASSDFPETIPASRFSYVNFNGTTINTPFDVNFFASAYQGAARGNRPATFVQFNYNAVLNGVQALREAIDPLGVPIVISPDYCLISPFDEVEAKMAFQSQTFPAIAGRSTDATVAAAVPGFMRGAFGSNPIQGMFKIVMNIHLRRGVWAIGQAHKGYVMQRRDPVEVVQELPGSGQDFETDVKRFRTRSRWEQEHIFPFAYLGNDGTASLSH